MDTGCGRETAEARGTCVCTREVGSDVPPPSPQGPASTQRPDAHTRGGQLRTGRQAPAPRSPSLPSRPGRRGRGCCTRPVPAPPPPVIASTQRAEEQPAGRGPRGRVPTADTGGGRPGALTPGHHGAAAPRQRLPGPFSQLSLPQDRGPWGTGPKFTRAQEVSGGQEGPQSPMKPTVSLGCSSGPGKGGPLPPNLCP